MGLFQRGKRDNKKIRANSMVSERDKKMLKLLFVFIVMAGIIITFIHPDIIDYKYSLRDLNTKENMIEELKRDLDNKDSEIEEKIENLKRLKIQEIESEVEANEARQILGQVNLKLHIPSLLITLEQNAKENDIDLLLKYDQKNTYNMNSVPAMDVSMEEPEDDTITIGEGEFEPAPEIYHGGNGMYITSIPLEINGAYSNVREFINFLDTMDFLEPNYINLHSDGEFINGTMELQILHEEVR